MGIGRFAYTPVLPHMLAGAGLSIDGAGLVASANFAGYLAGALLAASRIVVGPRTLWLGAALLASAATTGAMGLTDSFAGWVLLRTLSGIASAFVLVLTASIALDSLARAGRPALGALVYAGVGTGIALSSLGVAAAIAADPTMTWRGLWIALGVLSLALVLPPLFVLTRREPPPAPAAAGEAAPVAASARSYIVAYGLFGFGYVITATFIVAMVRGAEGSPALETAVWLVVGLTAAPSVLVWNRIATRMGVRRAFVAALLLEAAGVLLTAVTSGPGGALAGAALLGATFVGITALGLVAARAASPGRERQAVALMTASFAAGQMAGPLVAGLIAARTGDFVVPSLMAAAALVAAAFVARR